MENEIVPVENTSRRVKALAATKQAGQRAWGIATNFLRGKGGLNVGVLKEVRLVWNLFWKKHLGILPRLAVILTIAYVLSPLDFLPLIVFDDITVILLGMKLFLAFVPNELLRVEMEKLGITELP